MLKGLPLMYRGSLAQMRQLTTYHQTYPHKGKSSSCFKTTFSPSFDIVKFICKFPSGAVSLNFPIFKTFSCISNIFFKFVNN